jgi:rubrerythrin
MSLLKSEPPAPVRSLEELLAIAYVLEHEAASHYAAFAEQARRERLDDLAALFGQLAEEERHHEHSVVAWSRQLCGKLPDAGAVRWELPETFDQAKGAELASSRLATAYRILSVAVQNEERAFALWSHIAAHADATGIREAAETMARQELQHAWQLRRARRQAYHAEGRDKARHADAKTLAGLAAGETRLADQLDMAAVTAGGSDAVELRRLATESRGLAADLDGNPAAQDSRQAETDILTLAERLVEDYLEIGDRAADEAVIARSQAMAERAVLRLAQLRAMGSALPRGGVAD